VFISRKIPDEALTTVLAQTNADIWPDDLPPNRDELLRRVDGVDGFCRLVSDRVDDELLDRAGPQLKVVSNYGVGLRPHRYRGPATRRGVAVGNTVGVLTETTADFAFGLLMAAARLIPARLRLCSPGSLESVESDVAGGPRRAPRHPRHSRLWSDRSRDGQAWAGVSICGSCTTPDSRHQPR